MSETDSCYSGASCYIGFHIDYYSGRCRCCAGDCCFGCDFDMGDFGLDVLYTRRDRCRFFLSGFQRVYLGRVEVVGFGF